jgi:hypothetical protein
VQPTINATTTALNGQSMSFNPALAISVTIQPGATALTVIPHRPSSIAKGRAMISTSALVVA